MKPNKPKITFGDIVSVKGYGSRVFKVESYRIESHYYPSEEWVDFVYDVFDVNTLEWLEADAEDLTLLAGAKNAEKYLNDSSTTMWPSEISLSAVKPNPDTLPPAARELSEEIAKRSKAQKVNALLDALNDYNALVDRFGDNEYKARVEYLTLKLAEISDGK